MNKDDIDDVLGYGDNENEPSKEIVKKALLQEDANILRIYEEQKTTERMKIGQDHKKEMLELSNSHELAMQKQAHALNEARFNSRLAPIMVVFILLLGIAIKVYGPNESKRFGETITTTSIGILSGIFIGKAGTGTSP